MKIQEKEAFSGRPKFGNFVRNKRAIGFGRLFVLLCLVLFGVTLWLFTKADQKINTVIGTEELDKISSKNIKFYFFDSMRLASSEFIKKEVDYSFIDPSNINCQLTTDKIIILNSDCKPNPETIKTKAIEEIGKNANDSLKQIEIETVVFCLFEKNKEMNFLRCYSDEINLSYERRGGFFDYVLSNRFNLNQTINFDEQLNLSEINKIYLTARNCQDVNCPMSFKNWDVEKIEKNGDYLVFSLITKKEYPFENRTQKIEWKFATTYSPSIGNENNPSTPDETNPEGENENPTNPPNPDEGGTPNENPPSSNENPAPQYIPPENPAETTRNNRGANLRILIIPVSQKNKANFYQDATKIKNDILNAFPLETCKEKLQVIIPELEDYGPNWRDGSCYYPVIQCNSNNEEKFRIMDPRVRDFNIGMKCAREYKQKTGNDYDRVVLLLEGDLSPHAEKCSDGNSGGGWTMMYGGIVFSQRDSVLHELGHTFGLNEQYCDDEYKAKSSAYFNSNQFDLNHFVKNPRFESVKSRSCGRFDIINPLRKSLGCGGALDPTCFSNFDNDGDTMTKGNMDRKNADRTVMGFGEKDYSIDEYNYIKKFVNCNKEISQSEVDHSAEYG